MTSYGGGEADGRGIRRAGFDGGEDGGGDARFL